jgi:hypothetical protein
MLIKEASRKQRKRERSLKTNAIPIVARKSRQAAHCAE